MPKLLRWATFACFAFAIFLPLSLIRAGGHYINDNEVTFEEFWRAGGGPLFFVAGIVFPLIGYGFVRARNWARYLYVCVHLAWSISLLWQSAIDALAIFAWTALAAYYLFRWRSVREYFCSPNR